MICLALTKTATSKLDLQFTDPAVPSALIKQCLAILTETDLGNQDLPCIYELIMSWKV